MARQATDRIMVATSISMTMMADFSEGSHPGSDQFIPLIADNI
jgi:hypothetical protein